VRGCGCAAFGYAERKQQAAKGRQVSATISANQPPLVLAPVGENPPSKVVAAAPPEGPAPTMDAPPCRVGGFRRREWARWTLRAPERPDEETCIRKSRSQSRPGAPRCLSLRQAQHHVGDDACNRDVEPREERSSGRFCGAGEMRPKDEKKKVMSHQRRVTTARTMWLARSGRYTERTPHERVANVACSA